MLAFLMLIDNIQWIILWFEDLFNLILIMVLKCWKTYINKSVGLDHPFFFN